MKFLKLLPAILIVTFMLDSAASKAQANKDYFSIDYYYKAKWGFADEFIQLWKVNHYPLLKKAMEKGDIISVTGEVPVIHSSEEMRWDFKVRIVFKDAKTALDRNLTDPYKKLVYPDQEKFKKDEQNRFEILIAHWDVMVEKIDLQ